MFPALRVDSQPVCTEPTACDWHPYSWAVQSGWFCAVLMTVLHILLSVSALIGVPAGRPHQMESHHSSLPQAFSAWHRNWHIIGAYLINEVLVIK